MDLHLELLEAGDRSVHISASSAHGGNGNFMIYSAIVIIAQCLQFLHIELFLQQLSLLLPSLMIWFTNLIIL
jgi:hypothetical protein